MDWKNDESDHSSVENFAWDDKNVVSKTMSDICLSGVLQCNVCSQGVQANIGNCKEARSFTSALERLELEAEVEYRNSTIPLQCTNDVQTEPSDEYDQELLGQYAKDRLLDGKSIQHSDILNFQGVMHSSKDVARYWKKDSRMWLWKSVKLMRRKNKFKSCKSMCTVNKENNEE